MRSLSPEEKKFIADRDLAFATDDLSWAAKMMPHASCSEVVEMAFHKARYDCVAASEEKRLESQAWLADRSLTRVIGGPIVQHGDPLPV